MVDAGVVLGLAGIATGGVSILYARVQAAAAKGQASETRRQAEQATHMTLLAANQAVFERLHVARERLGRSRILEQLRSDVPDLQRAIDAAGSWDDYVLVREVVEAFQDAYFMRQKGILTDGYWTDLVGQATIWAQATAMRSVFAFCVQHRLLSAEFVQAFEEVLGGRPLPDPGGVVPPRAAPLSTASRAVPLSAVPTGAAAVPR
jgi:hypothetical protein